MKNLFMVAVNTVLRSLLDIHIPKYDRRIEPVRRQPVLVPNTKHFKILWLHKRTTNSSCCLLSSIILSSKKTPTLTLSKLIIGGSCKGLWFFNEYNILEIYLSFIYFYNIFICFTRGSSGLFRRNRSSFCLHVTTLWLHIKKSFFLM